MTFEITCHFFVFWLVLNNFANDGRRHLKIFTTVIFCGTILHLYADYTWLGVQGIFLKLSKCKVATGQTKARTPGEGWQGVRCTPLSPKRGVQ